MSHSPAVHSSNNKALDNRSQPPSAIRGTAQTPNPNLNNNNQRRTQAISPLHAKLKISEPISNHDYDNLQDGIKKSYLMLEHQQENMIGRLKKLKERTTCHHYIQKQSFPNDPNWMETRQNNLKKRFQHKMLRLQSSTPEPLVMVPHYASAVKCSKKETTRLLIEEMQSNEKGIEEFQAITRAINTTKAIPVKGDEKNKSEKNTARQGGNNTAAIRPHTTHKLVDALNQTNSYQKRKEEIQMQDKMFVSTMPLGKSLMQQLGNNLQSNLSQQIEQVAVQESLLASIQKHGPPTGLKNGESPCKDRMTRIKQRSQPALANKDLPREPRKSILGLGNLLSGLPNNNQSIGEFSPQSQTIQSQSKVQDASALQAKKDEKQQIFKSISRERASTYLVQQKKLYKDIIKKNEQLIATVPNSIASRETKRHLLEKRKNMMVRSIYTSLKCKTDCEWNPAKIIQFVNNHEKQTMESRPKEVLKSLKKNTTPGLGKVTTKIPTQQQ